MSSTIEVFIQFLQDLSRGCHIGAFRVTDGLTHDLVYRMNSDGKIEWTKMSRYDNNTHDSFFWIVETYGTDAFIEAILESRIQIVHEPHTATQKSQSHIRRVEL